MKINQGKAEKILLELVAQRKLVFDRNWGKHKFRKFKIASTTEKGDIGEDFLKDILIYCGYSDIEVPQGRRGQYDLSVREGTQRLLFEVKVATKDTNNNFQFNGIRYDTRYTHLFCLGISPDNAGYMIIDKNKLSDEAMVSMAKGSNATFKITKGLKSLKKFDLFCDEVKNLIEQHKLKST